MIKVKSTETPTLKSIIEDLRRTASRTVMTKSNGPEYFRLICDHIAPLVGLEPHEFWKLIDQKKRIRAVIDIKHIAWTVMRSMAYSDSYNYFFKQYPFIKMAEFTGNDHSTIVCAVKKSNGLIKTDKDFARMYCQGLKKMIELCTG